MLTNSERRYYLTEHYIDEKSAEERAIRGKIRKHLRNSILDFSILVENMEERDIKNSLGKIDDRMDKQIVDTVGLLYRYQLICRHHDSPESFEDNVEKAIKKAGLLSGSRLEVSVDINVESEEDTDIVERFEQEGAEDLEPEEFFRLREWDYITDAEFLQELRGICHHAYPKVPLDEFIEKIKNEMGSYESLGELGDAIYDEYMEWVEKQREGREIRNIPNEHRMTPFVDREVYEKEGIGDMGEEELKELFGKGYPERDLYVYDGKKIFRPMPPITDKEPIVREVIED